MVIMNVLQENIVDWEVCWNGERERGFLRPPARKKQYKFIKKKTIQVYKKKESNFISPVIFDISKFRNFIFVSWLHFYKYLDIFSTGSN